MNLSARKHFPSPVLSVMNVVWLLRPCQPALVYSCQFEHHLFTFWAGHVWFPCQYCNVDENDQKFNNLGVVNRFGFKIQDMIDQCIDRCKISCLSILDTRISYRN